MALLDAVENGRVPRGDVSAYTARQIASLGSEPLADRLRSVWGELRSSPREKEKQIADYKKRLIPEALARAERVLLEQL